MPFSLEKLQEHTEVAEAEIYGQTLVFTYRPAVMNKAFVRRMNQLPHLIEANKRAYADALEAWQEDGEHGDPPIDTSGTEAIDETVAVIQRLVSSWDVEVNGKVVEMDDLPARVEDGSIPPKVLDEIFTAIAKVSQEVPKQSKRALNGASSRNHRT